MKKIAITQRLIENESYAETRDALDVRFAKLFEQIDALAVPVPTFANFTDYLRELSFDGIVLSGGNDIGSMGGDQLSIDRDRFEHGVIDAAIDAGIPVLGICRGMQVIAEHFGSRLKRMTNHVGVVHAITAVADTPYFDYLSKIGPVNSYHDCGIDVLGDRLIELARSEDGEIEALAHNEYRVLGQMWHPERGGEPRAAEVELIRHFFS